MRDRGVILTGLVIFLVLITFPVWFNMFAGRPPAPPEPLLPPGGGRCVEDTATMRTEHMRLLMDWRDEVVRANQPIYTAGDGRRFTKSLSMTCMGCHTDKEKFCDRCHGYAAVAPYCWDCHVAPRGEQ